MDTITWNLEYCEVYSK